MLQLIAGIDLPVLALETTIHQPTIKEIALVGELEFFQAVQILCFDKNTIIAANPKDSSGLLNMNNFQIFMTLITDPKVQDSAKKKNDILSVFQILFPLYSAQFLPRGIFFNNSQNKHSFTIDERNFVALQEAIGMVCGVNNNASGQNGTFKPRGQKAAEIAAKLMRGRQRAAAQRGESSASGGVLSRYISILTVGLQSMSLEDCLNLTIFQLYDLIERYGLYTAWDLDIKSRLAGGKPDSKPDDWMKNIH